MLKLPTPAEQERLALLMEEMGEAIQIIGKIQRHGYESSHPHYGDVPNRELLEKELGHVGAAITLMQKAVDVNSGSMNAFTSEKLETVQHYLHFQTP